MASPLLTQQTFMQCPHGGQVSLTGTPRVTVGAQRGAVLLQAQPFPVAGCTDPKSCASVHFSLASSRLKSGGLPVLLGNSLAACVPGGGVPRITAEQTRVQGT